MAYFKILKIFSYFFLSEILGNLILLNNVGVSITAKQTMFQYKKDTYAIRNYVPLKNNQKFIIIRINQARLGFKIIFLRIWSKKVPVPTTPLWERFIALKWVISQMKCTIAIYKHYIHIFLKNISHILKNVLKVMWSSTAGECILFMHIQNTFPFYNLVPYIKIKLIMSSSQVFLK